MRSGDIVRVRNSLGKCFDFDGYLFNGKIAVVLSIGGYYKDVTILIEGKVRSIHTVYLEVINEKRITR